MIRCISLISFGYWCLYVWCLLFLVYTRPQLCNKVKDEVEEVEEEVKEKSINDHVSILFVSKEMFM